MGGLANIISTVAPTIATALGGPFAGVAVNALCNVFGLKTDEVNADNIKKILASYPDKLADLQAKEIEFQTEIAKLNVEQEAIAQKDRDSARNRQIQLRDHMPNILAFINIGGYFLVFYFLVYEKVDLNNTRDIVMMMIGALIANYDRIVTYYFGTTNDGLHTNLPKGDQNATRK